MLLGGLNLFVILIDDLSFFKQISGDLNVLFESIFLIFHRSECLFGERCLKDLVEKLLDSE